MRQPGSSKSPTPRPRCARSSTRTTPASRRCAASSTDVPVGALRALLADQPTPDHAAITGVHARAGEIMRPPGALAWLDDIAAWVAGWQRTARPRVERPAALVFAADHGIAAAESVS